MKRIVSIFILFILIVGSVSATATVKSFYGKVKVKLDPASKWSRLNVGQDLPANALVSTGFNSQLVLDLGNATLEVLPLTRMKVEEITASQDKITTSLFLQGGKIKADVEKIEGQVNDFKIKSPVATASVRGTSFEFTGNTLTVYRGLVAFGAPDRPEVPEDPTKEVEPEVQGTIVAVQAGGSSELVSFGGKPVDPIVMAKAKSSVIVSTKPEVVKKTIIETISGTGVIPELPTPGEAQQAIEGKVKIRIEFNLPQE